jgi:hypothetical protein
MEFDEFRGYSEEEYDALVSRLVSETAAKLVSVRGSTDGLRRVIADYVHSGMTILVDLSPQDSLSAWLRFAGGQPSGIAGFMFVSFATLSQSQLQWIR